MFGNKSSSTPAFPDISPQHRSGGRIQATDELAIHANADTYTVDGNGTVTRLPSWPRGVVIFLKFTGVPTFVNSANLIMQGGANRTFAIGDAAMLFSDGNGVWRCYVTPASGTLLRSYLAGLTLSTSGSSTTFGIAAGSAADSTNVSMLSIASAYTKTTSAWAVGSGNGSLDTGTIANSTTYHVHLIQRLDTGIVDLLTSLSATAPALPANYTLSRRVGSMKTDGSAQWVKIFQDGDCFYKATPSVDMALSTFTGGYLTRTPNIPTGFNRTLIVDLSMYGNSGSAISIYEPWKDDVAPVANGYGFTITAGSYVAARVQLNLRASDSGFNARTTDNSNAVVGTSIGWIDTRGRDA